MALGMSRGHRAYLGWHCCDRCDLRHSDQHLGKEIFVFFDPEQIYTLTGTADLLVLTTDGSEYSHRRP